jgi:hypothetical protein
MLVNYHPTIVQISFPFWMAADCYAYHGELGGGRVTLVDLTRQKILLTPEVPHFSVR